MEILTDLLTELSEMGSYKAIGQVMQRRMLNLRKNSDLMRVCFMEAQFHPELREQIQTEVIGKMIDVAEAFFQTAMDRGVYRPMNPRMVARVFLGMFTVAGFSQETLGDRGRFPQLHARAGRMPHRYFPERSPGACLGMGIESVLIFV